VHQSSRARGGLKGGGRREEGGGRKEEEGGMGGRRKGEGEGMKEEQVPLKTIHTANKREKGKQKGSTNDTYQ
jgi:hypothetical protein